MASSIRMTTEDAISSFQLSHRGGHNYVHVRQWASFEKSLGNPWTPENPDGVVNLSLAENALMHQEISKYLNENLTVDPICHLTYGFGPKGSPRLRKALAAFLNSNFRPRTPVQPDELVVLNGVTSVVDTLTWSICNEGEGIIIPKPFYTGFAVDIQTRAKGVIVPALFQPLEEYQGFDDVFSASHNIKALENALKEAEEKGIKVRAFLLTNPHNPLGRCYPVEAIKEIARFCSHHNLHLISDEIYANSVFDNAQTPDAIPFSSILSLDLDGIIDSQFVHVAYGASKDFCVNGLRLGMLYTRNQGLLGSMASNSMLQWPPYVIQDVWAKILEDEEFTRNFFATNRQRLGTQFARATKFLDDHGIPYYKKANAGMFIWIDLRRFLVGLPAGADVPNLSIHRLSPEEKQEYQRREKEIGSRLRKNGVVIALGSNFFTEELGWFRLSFTAVKEALEVGLERIWKTLQEVEASGWN